MKIGSKERVSADSEDPGQFDHLCSLIRSGSLLFINPCHAEPGYPAFANSVDPDQLASEEANWSGSALFAMKYMNLQQLNPNQANSDWLKIRSGHGILIYSAWQGLI